MTKDRKSDDAQDAPRGLDARRQWQEEQRRQRGAAATAQRDAIAAQESAVEARRSRLRRPPPVAGIELAGQRLRVVNAYEAQRLLADVVDTDRERCYRIERDQHLFPDPADAEDHLVFLVADAPLQVERLLVPRRLEGHPRLHVAGLICRGTLHAKLVSTVSGGAHSPGDDMAGMRAHGPCLVALGSAQVDVLRLGAGHHAFVGDLRSEALLAEQSGCSVSINGAAVIGCLLDQGRGICFVVQPTIAIRLNRGDDAESGHVIWRRRADYLTLLPSHRLEDVVRAELLERDARGHAQLVPPRLNAITGVAGLLRPAVDVATAHADFPARLAAAMAVLARTLVDEGVDAVAVPPRSTANHVAFSRVIVDFDGQPQACHELLRQVGRMTHIRLRALQPIAGGAIRLHIEHLTMPSRDRHQRWAALDDNDAEACAIKLALSCAIRRLLARRSA